ncbi:MAG: hypothetical protein ACHQ4H_05280 [Ktedonobacterales bacterium]
MIIRIMTEDQFRLDDRYLPDVQRLDDQLEAALDSGDDPAFTATLNELTAFVREHGQTLPLEEVVSSDLIIPAPDMTLAEARARLHPVEAPTPSSDG